MGIHLRVDDPEPQFTVIPEGLPPSAKALKADNAALHEQVTSQEAPCLPLHGGHGDYLSCLKPWMK